MYGHEPPTRLKIRDLRLLAECPASGRPGTRMPTAALDRWKAVVDCIGEWYRIDPDEVDIKALEDRFMSWLDPVQRQVASKLFSTFRQIMPIDPDQKVEFGTVFNEVWDTEMNATIGAASQFSVTRADATEHFKIKTGRSRVSSEEAAVLIEGAEDPDSLFYEINLVTGEIDEISIEEDTRQGLISRLFAIPEEAQNQRGTISGLHCYQCSRPTRCGQYPSADADRAGTESRAVLISKKWLAKLPVCERQVAWARLYGVPKDVDEDSDENARLGSSFHEGAASALLADDPDAAFADYASSAPGSEQADLIQLWENHKNLVASEEYPFEVGKTEYGLGATFHAPGLFIDSRDREHQRTVAVALAGFADVVGREVDGTPAVVELRTGGGSSLPMEPELYALGAHLLLGDAPVVVHTHRIGNPENLECDRRVFDTAGLEEAKEMLRDAAATVASWHPHDALSPGYSVGEWCTWCPFEARCSGFRLSV